MIRFPVVRMGLKNVDAKKKTKIKESKEMAPNVHSLVVKSENTEKREFVLVFLKSRNSLRNTKMNDTTIWHKM